MPKQHLLVITGPVGGGKSATGISVARCLRSRGLTAAVIDLDDVYCMGRQVDEFRDDNTWAVARRACGALAESFHASGLDAVIVEGEFFSAEEWKELRTCVPPHVDIRFFTLVVSRDETFRRARGDPNRVDMDEGWYGQMHDKFVSSLEFLRKVSVCVETDGHRVEHVAALITDGLSAVPNPVDCDDRE